MSIKRFSGCKRLEPEEVECLDQALNLALQAMNLAEGDDPVTSSVAKRVLDIAASGINDPREISRIAVFAYRDSLP